MTKNIIVGDIFENVTVPGGVYSDLLQKKYIGDVLYGRNDTELRWVAQIDFVYLRKFSCNFLKLLLNVFNFCFQWMKISTTTALFF